MQDKVERAHDIVKKMLSPEHIAAMENLGVDTGFGSEFPQLAFDHAFTDLWTRPGLSLKERSLLTIGILIGGGHEKELRSHLGSGLRNGLTVQQLEEIIYHATAYAGFPAASAALSIAREVVADANS